MSRRLGSIALLTIAILATFGCVKAREPFRIVQMCLASRDEVGDVVDLMRSIAVSEGMNFVDNSAKSQSELNDINSKVHDPSVRLLNIAVRDKDGMGLAIGNLGFPNYQIVLSFTSGGDDSKAKRFSDFVSEKLESRWHVEPLPNGRGAQPLTNCIPRSQSILEAKG